MTTQPENFLQRPSKWFGIPPWRLSLLIIGLLFSILTHYAAGEEVLMHNPFFAWMAWIISILFIFVGGWQRGSRIHQKTLLACLGLIALGYLVRGFRPDNYPLVFYGEEASGGLVGLDILAGKYNNPFTMGWASFPALYFFIQAGSISIFGTTLAAVRIPSIIAGSFAVGATYLTAHAMYGKRVGLLTALLLVGFPIHIHFSRIGLSNVWDGMFYIAVIGSTWYAWEHENQNAFLLAGFGLGLSQYFYVTSHTLLVLIPAWLVLVSMRDRKRFKRLLPGIVLMALSTMVVVLPLAWFYIHHSSEFLAPMVRVYIFGESFEPVSQSNSLLLWKTILGKIWLGAQSFIYLPITNIWFPSNAPFLRTPLAELFLAGLVFLVFNLRESRNILIGMCLALFIFIGGFSEGPPAAQRYVAVIPVCLMTVAFGLDKIAKFLDGKWSRTIPIFATLVLLFCVVVSFRNALSYYFDFIPLSRHAVVESNDTIAQHLGEFLATQPEDTQVVFFGISSMGYHSIPSLQYLAPKIIGLDILEPWGSQLNPKPTSDHLMFVFLPENIDKIPFVQRDYPGGNLFEERTYLKKILYYYYIYEE